VVAVSQETLEYARDLFGGLGPISAKRMFGGAGLYAEGVMFAIIADEQFLMKADPTLAAEYDAAGSDAFVYDTRNGPRRIGGLMRLPDSALDDPDEALDWARKSLAVALAAKTD
jgi:DNA transformation protein